jgi:uncharacterized protein (DUF169 family)
MKNLKKGEKYKLNLTQLHEMGSELESWLRMRVHPVAIKMLKSREEVPDNAIIPTRDWKHKYALCQTISRAQSGYEDTIAMFKEDHWCFEPVVGLGLVERIPEFLEGHHRYPDSTKTLRAGGTWCQNMPYLEQGLYQGIVCAPLHKCNFWPDLILMNINGLMATYLLIIRNYIDGKDLFCQLSGHAACVYSIVPSLLNKECSISIPCKGVRRFTGTQDSEIIFTLIPEMLPDFISAIHHLQDHEWGIPILPELVEEYPLKPGYKAFGGKLGLDLRNSPPRSQRYEKY